MLRNRLVGTLLLPWALLLPSATAHAGTARARPPAATECTPADVQAAVDHASRARLASTLHELTHDAANRPTSRHVGSPNNGREVGWARSRLASYGLRARLQPFRSEHGRLANVVATIPGSGPGRVGVDADGSTFLSHGGSRQAALAALVPRGLA